MSVRNGQRAVARLFVALVTVAGLGTIGTGPASASSGTFSWEQSGLRASALPPPHEPDRGSCVVTRNGRKIRLDCTIKKEDTTLWVACSGGFVEARHLNPPGVTAEGTCPVYGGYALTYTSAN